MGSDLRHANQLIKRITVQTFEQGLRLPRKPSKAHRLDWISFNSSDFNEKG
jgi:hypothetical protein